MWLSRNADAVSVQPQIAQPLRDVHRGILDQAARIFLSAAALNLSQSERSVS